MTVPLLQFENIVGGYGDTEIISGISGSVYSGHVLGVFGRNGVGKTTLSKLLAGALPLFSGSVILKGTPLSHHASYVRRRYGVGYMPQTSMVFDSLTVQENLSLARSTQEIDDYLAAFPRLSERMNQLAGSMSGGERKILAFVRTMLEDTSVIILDEPTEGVQPENIDKMRECIAHRQQQGTAFVLVEQNMEMLMTTANGYLGIDSGRTVFTGDRESTHRDEILSILSV